MKKTLNGETLIETAAERLIREIVACELAPGQKLLIADLKERYEMGASPLREALSRLCSSGFVVFDSGRGFRVAPMSKEDLEDITAVREVIETAALRRAIAAGDDEWEVGIVAAYARLERAAARHGEGDGPVPAEAEGAHKQFHGALVAACGSKRLIEAHSTLYDQARRYRHQMLELTYDLEDFLRTHRELMRTTLAREADEACAKLAAHLRITLVKVYP
ncbi:MAG: FCD domain-containing protein [Pseudomonadota bacterium]